MIEIMDHKSKDQLNLFIIEKMLVNHGKKEIPVLIFKIMKNSKL